MSTKAFFIEGLNLQTYSYAHISNETHFTFMTGYPISFHFAVTSL